jgi:hypothetical protein
MQEDESGEFALKVTNYFWDEEGKKPAHGFPIPEGNRDDYTKDDWKIFFLQVRKFLINYTRANMEEKIGQAVYDRKMAHRESDDLAAETAEAKLNDEVRYDQGEIPPGEVPF